MTDKIIHKRGDSFEVSGVYSDASGAPIDITDMTIASEIRNVRGHLVESLTVQITGAAQGAYRLVSAGTQDWPVDQLQWDIQYSQGSVVISTETLTIDVQRDITQ